MKMISQTIDQTIFERVLSSATNSSNNVFDKIQPSLCWAEQQLDAELLGPLADNLSSVVNLEGMVIKLICLRTYYEQIPQLDLVLTPTGFGIVSNTNLAPASADRVKALRDQVKNAYEDTYDRTIEMLIGDKTWADSSQARINVVNMIYTAKILRLYTDKPNAHRSDLEACHVAIYKAEEKVREHISAELFDSLLVKIREDDIDKLSGTVIGMIQRFIGYCIQHEWSPAINLLAKIEDLVEKNAENLPVYMSSHAYKIKHFDYFKNDKENSAYFFG